MLNLIFLFTIAYAAELPTSIIKIGDEKITFYENKQLRVLTSKICDELKNDTLCPNLTFLETLNTEKPKSPAKSKPNYGSRACETVLKSKVFLGYDSNGNEMTFCKVNNDFYLDLGTLSYYVERNKGLFGNGTRRRK